MTLLGFLLVILSCLLHASWNILGKASKGSSLSFSFVMTLTPAVLLTPFLVSYFTVVNFASIPGYFWIVVLLSGFCQMIYLTALISAYRETDVSIVYPVVRSLPVLMVGLICCLLGWSLSLFQWLGFVLIVLGCLFVPLSSINEFKLNKYRSRGLLWAFLSALGTAGYSVLDKLGLNLLTAESGESYMFIAVFYLACQAWTTLLAISLISPLSKNGLSLAAVRETGSRAALTGILMSVTYGLVLYAMTMVDNVSFVVALRQLSIVFGVLMGCWLLKERWYWVRGIGGLVIVVGLMLSLS
ncbi:multidrug transporter [Endozoicomonas sp. OPT23]|uniref:EamA family transporter n=1 Tax=Endozoicomonas sp. OPT23 TaxID=2072845 RepID=UPI00129A3E0B|nr:EamA family transporter [Endozoicomonas sp. OPT23]MRI32101.1 multidrug transporter [Endozoicomonas sp. OPT23]